MVKYHSAAACSVPQSLPSSLADVLHSWSNKSLWRNWTYEGDGEWIYRGLLLNSLVIVSDGSYMPKVVSDVCSCAVVVYCKLTQRQAHLTWVEKMNRFTADNYRAEGLGGLGAQLIVRAATQGRSTRFGCDNIGIVRHGNQPRRPMPEKQSQADILGIFKRLIADAGFHQCMYHIYAHLDEVLEYHQLSTEERMNCLADTLASEALVHGVASEQFIRGPFPFEMTSVFVNGKRVSGSPKKAIERHWGAQVARKLFHDKRIVNKYDFNLVYWDGMEAALNNFPDIFCTWITKKVSHFCATNRHLSHISSDHKNVCPSCGCENESPSHLTKCPDEARTAAFTKSVGKLVKWLESQRMSTELITLIEQYLLARGSRSMTSLLHSQSDYKLLAQFHDRLGWDCFVEGRICVLWLEARELKIHALSLCTTAEHWARGFIRQLLLLTHHQLIFRNAGVHHEVEGLTPSQHEKLMEDCEEMVAVHPGELLPEHRDLLQVNFDELGAGHTLDRQYWLADMESALSAADHVRNGSRQVLRTRYCTGPRPRMSEVREDVFVDNEGSICWRRRQRRV